MSRTTYTKTQEDQITRRALGRILEMNIYLTHHSTCRPADAATYQIAEIDALRSLDGMPDDVRALHIRDLEQKYPEAPTPVQAAIADFARASADAMKQHEEEVTRFYAAGSQNL